MLLIYLPQTTARIEYIFKIVFELHLGVEYTIITDVEKFTSAAGAKLNYSDNRIGDSYFIRAQRLLFENGIHDFEILIKGSGKPTLLFPNDDDFGMDLFAASFFLLTRYEEYLPFEPDLFGRFPAKKSIAFQHDFLEFPVVDIWINKLKEELQKRFPELTFKSRRFQSILTYDIDIAYKYKGRNFLRLVGSTFKDLVKFDFKNLHQRALVLLKIKKDSWDIYDDLKKNIQENKLNSIFFFLVGGSSRVDKNIKVSHPLMKKLIQAISGFSEIGIHPSFSSNGDRKKLELEKQNLEIVAKRKIIKSRQHFLKLKMPDTYVALIASGIKEDYTMGFPDAIGFRAGTCIPFPFFDLKENRMMELEVYPVACMEGALMRGNAITNIKDALQKILFVLNEAKNVQGTFICIWHNHTISKTLEYQEWKTIHDKMIGELIKINAS